MFLNMKNFRSSLIVLLIFGIIFGACSKDEKQFVEVKLDFELNLPAGLNSLETHYFVYDNVPNFYTQSLLSNGISKERVDKVTGYRARLSSSSGTANFELFRRISIFAVERNNPSNRLEMFYLDDIPFGISTEIDLLTSISNLKSIMESDDLYTLEFQIEFKTFVPFDQRIKFDYSYVIFFD